MTRLTLALCALAALATAGCATKNYGRQGELTDFETRTMNCREIELETARVHGFLNHVEKESDFDGRSILSFLGDFGVGNVLEKSSAVSSATTRLAQLDRARVGKGCGGHAVAGQAAPSTQALAAPSVAATRDPGPAAPAQTTAAKPPLQLGRDGWQADKALRGAGCGSKAQASLTSRGPGFELYSATCIGGDVMKVRCEMGSCTVVQ